MQTISSTGNAKFKHARALLSTSAARKKASETVLEGVHLLTSYGQKGFTPKQLWLSEDAQDHPEIRPLLQTWQHVPCFILAHSLYKQLRSIGQGVDALAIINLPTPTLKPVTTDALVLNDVQDVGNVGTLLRTAAAVGVKNILTTEGTASCYSPKCLRAGMGAQFSLNIFENLSLDEVLDNTQTPLLATSSHSTELIYNTDLTQPVTWVLGNEGQGVASKIIGQSQLVSLPQPSGEESLNVAIAGSLCMYEMLRQRLFA